MKTYTLEPTKHKDLFRVVDRNGNWNHYYHKPTNKYLRSVTGILERSYPKGKGFEEWLLKITPQERDEILSSTGEKGDRVHRAIDLLLSSEGVTTLSKETGIYSKEKKDYEPISNDEWDALLAFSHFWNRHEPTLYVSEAPLFNLSVGYAGTADAIITLTKACDIKTCPCNELTGKVGLFDWKTSSGIRPSHSAQSGAYCHAENIGDYTKKVIEYGAVLRLGTRHKTTSGYEFESFSTEESYRRFAAAQKLDDFEYSPFEEKEIQDIPDTLEIKIQTFVEKKEEKKEKPKKKKIKKSKKK